MPNENLESVKSEALQMLSTFIQNQEPLPDKIVKHFKEKHKISIETLQAKKIGFGQWMPNVDGDIDCIQYPYTEDQKVVNVRFRNKKTSEWLTAAQTLFNVDSWNSRLECMIVQTELDVLSWAEVGMDVAASIPDIFKKKNLNFLESKFVTDRIKQAEKIFIAIEDTAQGNKIEDELVRRIGKHKCWKIKYPDDCKNANEVLTKKGADALKECWYRAKQYPISGVFTVEDFKKELQEFYEKGFPHGLSTTWHSLDKYYRIWTSAFTLVTGIPQHGKSAWMRNLMVRMSKRYGWKWSIFSPESYPIPIDIIYVCRLYLNKAFEGTERMTPQEYAEALEFVSEHFSWIQPNKESTLEAILDISREVIYRNGSKGIVIDPWNHLEHSWSNNTTETDYISRALNNIDHFVKDHDVHLWLMAHPTKMKKNNKGKLPVPSLYDVHGSANFANKPYAGITIWRDVLKDTPEVKVFVTKMKSKLYGKAPGEVTLIYDEATEAFNEPESTIIRDPNEPKDVTF